MGFQRCICLNEAKSTVVIETRRPNIDRRIFQSLIQLKRRQARLGLQKQSSHACRMGHRGGGPEEIRESSPIGIGAEERRIDAIRSYNLRLLRAWIGCGEPVPCHVK
jgi:hypothetical protein